MRQRLPIVLALVALAVALLGATGPAVAHVGGTVSHLWNHIRPKADQRYANAVAGTDKARSADTLDGLNSTAFLRAGAKAANAELLDGLDSTAFLEAGAKAADSDQLDGLNSTDFLTVDMKSPNSELLDGLDSTEFLPAGGKAADANLLDGRDSTSFLAGGGSVFRRAFTLPANGVDFVTTPFSHVLYACPANPSASNGLVAYQNNGPAESRIWIDDGSTVGNRVLGSGSFGTHTAPGGDHVSIAATHGLGGNQLVQAEVFSIHTATTCSVVIQAITS